VFEKRLADRGRRGNNASITVREDRFTTLVKDPPEQFGYWRDAVAPLMEVQSTASGATGFYAKARAYDLGRMHFASLRVDPMKFRRTPQRIRKSHIDHWQLVLRKRGSESGAWGGRLLRSGAGSLDIRSLATPCVASASASELVCVWMSRDAFSAMAGPLDAACHQPISGTMKIVLREFILAVERYKSSLTVQEIPVVVNSLAALIGAVIQPTEEALAQAATPISAGLFEAARQFVDANLSSPTLGPDAICRELNVSRRKLYYMFEHHGGLLTFIRTRRLTACHEALANLADPRLISTIAYKHGFSDATHFSRAFRAQYGYSPKEVREAGGFATTPPAALPGDFMEWLRVRSGGDGNSRSKGRSSKTGSTCTWTGAS
jgi:AraC-like DNA-binding protein